VRSAWKYVARAGVRVVRRADARPRAAGTCTSRRPRTGSSSTAVRAAAPSAAPRALTRARAVNRTKPMTQRRLKELEAHGQGLEPITHPLEFNVEPEEVRASPASAGRVLMVCAGVPRELQEAAARAGELSAARRSKRRRPGCESHAAVYDVRCRDNACTTRVVRQGHGIESARYVIVMS
jgi:hypothetical protein